MRFLRGFLAGCLALMAGALVPSSGASARGAAATAPSMWTESSYSSVFKDSGPSADAADALRLDAAKNDYESAQVVLRSGAAFTVNGVDFTALTGPSDSIAPAQLSFHPVGYEYLNHNSVFGGHQIVHPTVRTAPGEFPDRLLNQTSIQVPANTTQSLWVRVHVPASAAGGVYTGQVTVRTTAGDVRVALSVNTRNVVIPPTGDSEFTTSIWTAYFDNTIKETYGFDRYSDQWWQLMDNLADTMAEYRQNDLPLPTLRLLIAGGSTVDAAGKYTFQWGMVDQFVDRMMANGVVKRIEAMDAAGPLARTDPSYPKWHVPMIPKSGSEDNLDRAPWDSAEANNWYAQFIPALKAHVEAKGWTDEFWMHIGDEPGDGGEAWVGVATKVRQYWPGIQLGDALHNARAAEVAKSADIVIPSLLTYTENPAPFDAELAKGKEMWFYNANVPVHNHLNRFVDQPYWSQRMTMWLAYGRGATGYLHWAYNRWEFRMDNQDVKGDAYIVRPDVANKTIESTPRYESLRDGIEDWEILNQLGKTNPGLARDLSRSLVQRSDKYTPDTAYMQRIRAIALDAAGGKPVVAKDLAGARTATASSQQAGSEAAKAVDGSRATDWQPTTGSGTQWVQADLSRQGQVDGVRLHWGSVYATSYKVQISSNGGNWADAFETTSGDGGDDFIGINGKTRFIRVQVTAGSGGATPYRLADLEVAGNALLQQNLAGGKPYTATTPSGPFPDSGREATDGVLADDWTDGRTFGYKLANGSRLTTDVSIDLGYPQSVGLARIHAYEEYPDYRPDMVNVATSNDGVNYTSRGLLSFVNGASRVWYDVGFAPVQARFVRVTFEKRGTPTASAMFIDDIEVYGTGSGGADVTPGSAAFQWGNQEIVVAPSAAGSLTYWNWTPGAGMISQNWAGGPIAGKTSGFAWNDQQHAVARGTDGKLQHWWLIQGESQPHHANWGGDAASDPTTVVWGGQQHIFTRATGGGLSHWWWDPADAEARFDTWAGAPELIGTPSAYVWNHQLHVVARGANNHLYHWWWITGEFEPHFADWGGEVYSDPTTLTWNGQQHVFAKAADGNVFHWWWDPADGQLRTDKWTGAPAAFVGSPASFKYGTMQHVYARGAGNSLYHWWWDQNTGLVSFEDKGGQAYSDPVVFGYGDQQQIFAQSATNTLYHWWHTPQDGWHLDDWGGSVKYPGQ